MARIGIWPAASVGLSVRLRLVGVCLLALIN
ncbi:MAG: hypothetical protein J07HR59_00111, partial [Halorubrum sp. J07HR59]